VAENDDNELAIQELTEYLSQFRDHYFAWLDFINSEWRSRLARWKNDRLVIHKQIVEAMRRGLPFDRNGRLDTRTVAGKRAIRAFVKDGGVLDKHLTLAIHSAHKHFGIDIKRNPEGLVTHAGLKDDSEIYFLSHFGEIMRP
jgi:hypothetical protein